LSTDGTPIQAHASAEKFKLKNEEDERGKEPYRHITETLKIELFFDVASLIYRG
jgi:hypothetical protein